MSRASYKVTRPELLPLAPADPGSGSFHASGTFVMALVFLLSFVVYFFINAKYLSSVWPLG
jgi:cytochrome c oxidase subunit 1